MEMHVKWMRIENSRHMLELVKHALHNEKCVFYTILSSLWQYDDSSIEQYGMHLEHPNSRAVRYGAAMVQWDAELWSGETYVDH